MRTVAAISFWRTHSPSRLAWSEGWRPPRALSLHSANEPGELSQWLSHDDSTINIISVIIIIITRLIGTCALHQLLRFPVTLGDP